MNETKTIELTKPIKVNGVEVSTLTMRTPTVGDQLVFDKNGENFKEVKLIANLCSVSPEDMKAMPLKDYMNLQEAYAGLLTD